MGYECYACAVVGAQHAAWHGTPERSVDQYVVGAVLPVDGVGVRGEKGTLTGTAPVEVQVPVPINKVCAKLLRHVCGEAGVASAAVWALHGQGKAQDCQEGGVVVHVGLSVGKLVWWTT